VSPPARAWRALGQRVGARGLIGAALTAFALQGKAVVRAFRRVTGGPDRSAIEVPNSWFYAGAAVAGVGLVWMADAYFHIPLLFGALAVLLAFVLCLVAARITGETDVTPTGAMGKVVQLTYGGLMPQKAVPNLMTASITSGSASACADLLNDLKSGYLLGANPRRQFVAQFLGIFSGTVATVIGFRVLVPGATKLPIAGVDVPQFAAPAAVQWKAVADLLTKGLDNFHPTHQRAIVVGLILGAALTLAEKLSRKEWRKWMPSPTGFGLGFILPFANNLSFFLGGLAILIWSKASARSEEQYGVATASGVIAGAAILGVIVAILNNFVFNLPA
jgi:OPT family oligopeptide transporter